MSFRAAARNGDKYLSIFNFYFISIYVNDSRHAGGFAGGEIKAGAVPGALYLALDDVALAQMSAVMRADIIDRIDYSLESGDRDWMFPNFDRLDFPLRDIDFGAGQFIGLHHDRFPPAFDE